MPQQKDTLDSRINNALTGRNPEIALNSLIDEITNKKEDLTETSLDSLQTQLFEKISASDLEPQKKEELKQAVETKVKAKRDLLEQTQ